MQKRNLTKIGFHIRFRRYIIILRLIICIKKVRVLERKIKKCFSFELYTQFAKSAIFFGLRNYVQLAYVSGLLGRKLEDLNYCLFLRSL